MLPALGHCEDTDCQNKSSESVRLFRCSIHCDRNLCLLHLNAHNVYYEEEKKQNTIVINELQNTLSLYQTIFEKQIVSYRELVRQASAILLHNTSSLKKLQQAISIFHDDKIVIKCESSLDTNESNQNSNVSTEPAQKVVVRIPRIECNANNNQTEKENVSENDENAVKFPDEIEKSSVNNAKRISEGMKRRTASVKRLQK